MIKTLTIETPSVSGSDDASGADSRPPLLVTASVDRISLARRLSIAEDLSMSGQVVWTGRSAMDIRMQLTQASCRRAMYAGKG